jgi:hypothetical protein
MRFGSIRERATEISHAADRAFATAPLTDGESFSAVCTVDWTDAAQAAPAQPMNPNATIAAARLPCLLDVMIFRFF